MDTDTESISSPIHPRPFWMHALIGLVVMVFLAGILILMLLFYRNRTTMPEFGTNSASINSLNIAKSRITAEWNITLFITNHDSYHRLYYDDITIKINYNNEQQQHQNLLSVIPLKPFSQRSGFTNIIPVQQNMDVNNDVAKDIASGSSHGMVNFEVVFSGSIKFKDVFEYQKVRTMKIVCDPLSLISQEDHLKNPHDDHLKGSPNWILSNDVACQHQ